MHDLVARFFGRAPDGSVQVLVVVDHQNPPIHGCASLRTSKFTGVPLLTRAPPTAERGRKSIEFELHRRPAELLPSAYPIPRACLPPGRRDPPWRMINNSCRGAPRGMPYIFGENTLGLPKREGQCGSGSHQTDSDRVTNEA